MSTGNRTDPIIIGLAGAGGTGKSTLANLLVTRYGAVRMAFADPLKKMLRVLLTEYGYTEQQANRYIDGDLKEERCPALDGKTGREAQQYLGTEYGRDLISQKLWTNLLLARLDALEPDQRIVVVDDVRMDNEADALLSYSWSPAAVYRMFPVGDAKRHPPKHRSEVGINPTFISADIVHDFTLGSLEAELQAKIVKPFNLQPIGAWSHGT